MSQFRGFACRVQNGSTVVRAMWYVTVGTVTGGPFQNGEGLTWGVDGVGVLVDYNAVENLMILYRTSGASLAVGDTITGGTSAATTQVAALEAPNLPRTAGSPPLFGTSPEQGAIAQGDTFMVLTQNIRGQVGVVWGDDFINLAANWGGVTEDNVSGVVQRDRTTELGLAIIKQGDSQAGNLLTDNDQRLEAELRGDTWHIIGGGGEPAFQNGWANDAGGNTHSLRFRWAANGMVRVQGFAFQNPLPTLPSVVFTLPAGYRPLTAREFWAISSDASLAKIQVGTDGTVTIASGVTGTTIPMIFDIPLSD